MKKLCIFVITKVHGQEILWLRKSFLASKMRKTHLHASVISKIIPGLYPGGVG
jgi:hypothetical protein